MKPKFSEFSYAYAVTENVIRGFKAPLKAAPVIPSLFEEGQTGGGYDVMLARPGIPLYYQFKLSEYMTRASAKNWNLFNNPHYRFKIWSRKHSKQQQLLLDLEQGGDEVYYVAPAFHKVTELDQHYRNQQVDAKSIFVKPSFIGALTDDAEHHVKFVLGSQTHFCSDPKEIRERVDAETMIDRASRSVLASLDTEPQKKLSEMLTQSRDNMLTIIRRRRQARIADLEALAVTPVDAPLHVQVAYLARTFFGCETLLVSFAGADNDDE